MSRNMKKITSLLTGCAITLLTASCEKDLPVFSTNDCWLNFAYYDYYNELITSNEEITDEMRTTYYSFITSSAAAGKELQTDTIWLEVTTMGFLSDKDRQIELVQLQTDATPFPGNITRRSIHRHYLRKALSEQELTVHSYP